MNKRGLLKQFLSLPVKGKLVVAWRLFRDPRVPLVAKLVFPPVALYLVMPIDIIPDFIPVIGQLDDLLIVAGGMALFLRLCPGTVVVEHIERYRANLGPGKGTNA